MSNDRRKKDQLILKIRNYLIKTAKILNVKPSFAKGRRKSDILVIKLRGNQKYASTITTHLEELLSKADIEIPRSFQKEDCLTLIITEELANQEIIIKERRAKLIKFLEKGPVTQKPVETFEETDVYNTLFLENMK